MIILGFLLITAKAAAAFTHASDTAFIFGAPIPREKAPKIIPKKQEIMSPGVKTSPALFVYFLSIKIAPNDNPYAYAP